MWSAKEEMELMFLQNVCTPSELHSIISQHFEICYVELLQAQHFRKWVCFGQEGGAVSTQLGPSDPWSSDRLSRYIEPNLVTLLYLMRGGDSVSEMLSQENII